MTAAERERLREARDAEVRRRIAAAGGERFCWGCGGDLDSRTIGCRTCWGRHRKRQDARVRVSGSAGSGMLSA